MLIMVPTLGATHNMDTATTTDLFWVPVAAALGEVSLISHPNPDLSLPAANHEPVLPQ